MLVPLDRWGELLTTAIELGLSPDQFWNATPRELALHAKARARLAETNLRRQLFLAWHVAALGRVDKLPPLEEFLQSPRKETPEQELERRAREHEEVLKTMAAKLKPNG